MATTEELNDLLIAAVRRDDTKRTTDILGRGADVNAQCSSGVCARTAICTFNVEMNDLVFLSNGRIAFWWERVQRTAGLRFNFYCRTEPTLILLTMWVHLTERVTVWLKTILKFPFTVNNYCNSIVWKKLSIRLSFSIITLYLGCCAVCLWFRLILIDIRHLIHIDNFREKCRAEKPFPVTNMFSSCLLCENCLTGQLVLLTQVFLLESVKGCDLWDAVTWCCKCPSTLRFDCPVTEVTI